MITVTATRHRHRDSSPRAIDPAAVVETTLLALDKMNECVDAFARRVRDAFETHLAGALPLDALGASGCLLYTSPSPRDATLSRMPSSA